MTTTSKHLLSALCAAIFILLAIASTDPARVSKQTEVKSNFSAAVSEISAAQLLRDYKNDVASSNNRYIGKIMRVTGTVERSLPAELLITVTGTGYDGEIVCNLVMDQQAKARQLKYGDAVSFIGVCDGKNDKLSFRSCIIQ
jgi:hypothetical protein